MLRAEDLKLLGVFLKTHGIGGHLVLKLSFFTEEELEEGEPVFIVIDGIPVPFFISEFRYTDDYTALVKFDETHTSEEASEFVNCSVYSEKHKFKETRQQDNGGYDKFKGFRVVDEYFGESGILQEIIEFPENPVMRIDNDGAEILVPFHDEIVKYIDHNSRVIFISAPDGLFDLYL